MLQIDCQINLLTQCYNSATNALMRNPWRIESMVHLKRDRLIDSKCKTPWENRGEND